MIKFTKENPLRVFTTFSGYDSQALALRKANIPFEMVGWSEIEPRAINAHNLIFPEFKDRNYGDICKIDWENVPDFDFFTYSSPCFVAGTLIQTKNGLKNIEDIKVGDEVLTHTNTYQKVVTPMSKVFGGTLYHIKSANGKIVCTPEHPFYVREKSYKYESGKKIRVFGKPIWKKANELSNKIDFLGTPVNQESKFPEWNGVELYNWGHNRLSNKLNDLFTNHSFWYLMGRYVGDGWTNKLIYKPTGEIKSRSIKICCSKKKESDYTSLKEAFDNCGFNYCITKERTVYKFQVTSKELWEFVQRYGQYADGKFIDIETLNLPVEYLKSFVEGYIDSDGYKDSETNSHITTVSKKLAYTFAQCVNKVYHRPVSLIFNKLPSTHIIEGRIVNQKDTYTVQFKKVNTKQDKSFYEDGYIWSPVNTHKNGITTEEIDSCIVYNMEVENDNSYVANNYIVHNCQSFSIAGQQLGGEEGSGTKSSLLWECKKAIEIKKPKYLMLENVKNLVGNKFRPTFQKWLDYLSSIGYTSYWKVLNGVDYGTAQARERVFVVSILNPEYDFEFPRPMKLDISLEDYLQQPHQIPTKCYAPQTAINEYVENNPGLLKFAGVINDVDGSGHIQIGTKTELGMNPDFIRMGKQMEFICKDAQMLNEENILDENLFGESITNDNLEVNKVNKILQIGNIRKNRRIFVNPMQFRVYSPKGACPTLTLAYPPLVLTKENGEYKIRELSGFECMRAMGVEDDDIQKLVDGGVSNTQLMKLAGNSICVDVMMNFYKQIFKL